ncbi:MAG: xanthine dehydrogenase family protein [Phycisphaerae bacterium]|nr:xanthine dehydrogenase family protein molybdopterin-binding subunit [Phycisphaerae bacterium]NUQ45032.1 xanthine dehydrogenase family protein [Phycisphaerae bacterium]
MSIGADIPRLDGAAKLLGTAAFVDDERIAGVLHGVTIRSPVARGRIRAIRFDPSIDWSQFTIVDHRDLPGPNQLRLIDVDMPVLAATEVRYKHEPIALIAHRSPRAVREALHAVHVDVDPLPPVFDPRTPLTPELIQYGADNVFKRIDIRKGDPAAVFASAAYVIEGEYVTGAQEHVYLETNGMLAFHADNRLVVRGSMQCPYYVLDALTHAFARPRDAFRVVQTPVGGGFGGKEDFPSLLAVHAALLAEKAGRPVKFVYDRQEDMAVTPKRHPARIRHRTAADRDGRLLAMEVSVLMDGGAYVTLSPVVLSRGTIHAAGPYRCEHIHIHGETRLTNSTPYGAFRGFGAPQTLFAIERHMDVIADRLGLDPAELRRRNLLKPGDTLATGQVFRDDTDLVALLDNALMHADYTKKKSEHAGFNAQHGYMRRGIGFACFQHGSGFTGAGETYLASEVWVEGLPDGRVEVQTAQTDMGQGTTTILAQIAADRLGVSTDAVCVAQPDTSRVPNSGPTVASRTAMVVGRLVEQACDDLAAQLGAFAAQGTASPGERIRDWHARRPGTTLRGRARYVKPDTIQWDEKHYRGDAYAGFAWAVHVAEVEVDLRTFATRVTDYVALQEIGRVVNPTLARGQVQGGVAQGIGWALYEKVALEDGAMKNAQMTNYIIPGCADLPPIRVFFDEQPSPYGPRGAKGIGELPIDGPAPAVINAVCRATRAVVREIPMTPEDLMELHSRQHGRH